MKECGKKIEDLMREKGITLIELVKKTEISKYTLQRIVSWRLFIIEKLKLI